MSTLLILRPEIFSIFIMVFLITYDRYCARYRTEKDIFFKFALVCLAHCVMALVTEITVNMETVPKVVNDACHLLFFLFSLLYSLFFLEYALSLILPKGKLRRNILVSGYVISAICVVAMIVSPIEYIVGANTKYSAGLGPTLCYMLGFLFFIAADFILIVNRKRIKRSIVIVMLPLSFITLGFLVFQILVPEFLYTAQALTVTAVGLFFAIENPVGKFQTQAFIDSNAQIWNRNCYEYDLTRLQADKLVLDSSKLIYVVGDINGLKAVNDNLGHVEGDKLIEGSAHVLQKNLKSAFKVYRVGGDEFIALFFDVPLEEVQAQVKAVEEECNGVVLGENIPVGISIGYAARLEGEPFKDTCKRAEQMMYENKRGYYKSCGFDRRSR